MKVLDRLKMELSNQQYFSDEQYTQFLTENSLSPTDEYDKSTMQMSLLFNVVDVLEAVTNDIDLMTGISTELSTYYGPNFICDLGEIADEMLPYTKRAFEGYLEGNETNEIVSSDAWY